MAFFISEHIVSEKMYKKGLKITCFFACERRRKVGMDVFPLGGVQIAAILGIGRIYAYKLVKEGHFKMIRIGSAIRISKKSFDDWMDSLEL